MMALDTNVPSKVRTGIWFAEAAAASQKLKTLHTWAHPSVCLYEVKGLFSKMFLFIVLAEQDPTVFTLPCLGIGIICCWSIL